MQWQPIPPAKVPGILRGYRVTYRKKNSKELNEISLNATHHRVIIKGLQPLTEYELSVAGFTNWGTGPESVKVHVITPSTGKRVASILVFVCTITSAQRYFQQEIFPCLLPSFALRCAEDIALARFPFSSSSWCFVRHTASSTRGMSE